MPVLANVNEPQQSGWNHIDAIVDIGPRWNLLVPERNTIYYTFSVQEGGDPKQYGISAPITAFNATQQAAVTAIFSYVSQLTGIQFSLVNNGNSADIHFANTDITNHNSVGLTQWWTDYTYNGAKTLTNYNVDAYIYIDNAEYGEAYTKPVAGNYPYEVLLHELGHALGLKHSFNDGVVLPKQEDDTNHTLMSYTSIGNHDHYSPYDIAALNWLYGGDGLVGALGFGRSGEYLMTTGLDELIVGSKGNDVLDGLAGADTVSYQGSRANYMVKRQGDIVSVSSTTEGKDSLKNIEHIKFSDMNVNLSIQSFAKTISPAQLQSLEELYVAFFNRVPDADGLNFWITQLKGGASVKQIADSFYQAGLQFPLQTGYTSTMSHADFVNVIYKNVLGRPEGADAEGLTYWTNRLDNASESYGSLVNSILYSAHTFKGDAKWGWVADLLDNKIHVAQVFAVNAGLNFNTAEESISQGMAIVQKITSTSYDAAIKLIGLPVDQLDLS